MYVLILIPVSCQDVNVSARVLGGNKLQNREHKEVLKHVIGLKHITLRVKAYHVKSHPACRIVFHRFSWVFGYQFGRAARC